MTQFPGNRAESSQSGSSPLFGIVAGVVGALVGPFVYMGWIKFVTIDQMVPTILMGPIVGVAIRIVARPVQREHVIAALVLAVAATLGGFLCGDWVIWTPFMLSEAVKRMLSIGGIMTIGLSIYLGYQIVAMGMRPPGSPGPPATPPH